MTSKTRRLNLEAWLAGVMIAPALSLVIAFLGAILTSLPELMATFDPGQFLPALFGTGVMFIVLVVLVSLWGFAPSALFGVAGVAVSELWLKSNAWWAWGLAGLATSTAYVAVAFAADRAWPAVSFFLAPWIFLNRVGQIGDDPPLPLADAGLMSSAASIVLAGFGAGVVYFLVRQGGLAAKRADKRS